MKAWNEALAAYDRDVEVLEGVREEYVGFLTALLSTIDDAVRSALGQRIVEELEYERQPSIERTWYPREDSIVEARAWAAAPCGGPAGQIHVWLYVGEPEMGKAGKVKAERDLRRRRFVEAFRARCVDLAGEPFDAVRHPGVESDAGILRIATLRLDAPRPETEIATTVTDYLRTAAALDETVQAMDWIEESLLALPKRDVPEQAGPGAKWQSQDLGAWQGGRYVEIDEGSEPGNEHHVWVCGLPPGKLIVGHYAEPIHARLCERLGARPITVDSEDGCYAEIFDETRVAQLFAKKDSQTVVSAAWEAFATYFDIVRRK